MHTQFEEAISALDKIQEAYREYHGMACYAADKEIGVVLDEMCRYLEESSGLLGLTPTLPNSVIDAYATAMDKILRLNSRFIQSSPPSVGHALPVRKYALAPSSSSKEKSETRDESRRYFSKSGGAYWVQGDLRDIVGKFPIDPKGQHPRSKSEPTESSKREPERRGSVPWLLENAAKPSLDQNQHLSPEEKSIVDDYCLLEYFMELSEVELQHLQADKKQAYENNLKRFRELLSESRSPPLDAFNQQPILALNLIEMDPLVGGLERYREEMLVAIETGTSKITEELNGSIEIAKLEFTTQVS